MDVGKFLAGEVGTATKLGDKLKKMVDFDSDKFDLATFDEFVNVRDEEEL